MALPLKCFRLLSLEEIALRRLTATLWTDPDILVSLGELSDCEISIKRWDSIVDKIKGKIVELKLQESVTKRMVEVATPIGLEIKMWEDFHIKAFNISCTEILNQTSAKFFFTMTGSVDDRRMAREVVLCSKMHVVQRYRLACSYWLEDCIPLLWKELTEEYKRHFSKRRRLSRGLEYAWTHTIQDRQSILDSTWRSPYSFNRYAFELSAEKGFKATAEYFFRKLSCEEREASLMKTARNAVIRMKGSGFTERRSNVVCLLLSLMTPEQQVEMVEEFPRTILLCFFVWPWRDLFSENAGLICPHLDPLQCQLLLMRALFRDWRWDNFFPEIFSQLLKNSPSHFKDYFMNIDVGLCYFLSYFFCFGDTKSIATIFRHLDSENRVNLFFRDEGLKLLYDEMLRGRWDLVRLCLQEATLPDKERKRLSETFCNYVNAQRSLLQNQNGHDVSEGSILNLESPPFKYFFEFLNRPSMHPEQERKGQKRKLED